MARPRLPLCPAQPSGRAGRDRLELLTALIGGPAFDPMLRAGVIRLPAQHPVFGWACLVPGCERPRQASTDMCHIHREQWATARTGGTGKAAFLAAAQPLAPAIWAGQMP